MALSPGRELIQISSQAYEHLQAIKAATEQIGAKRSATLIASEAILSLPIPTVPTPTVEVKRRTRKAVRPQAAQVPAL